MKARREVSRSLPIVLLFFTFLTGCERQQKGVDRPAGTLPSPGHLWFVWNFDLAGVGALEKANLSERPSSNPYSPPIR
jgi:hypothetical protein